MSTYFSDSDWLLKLLNLVWAIKSSIKVCWVCNVHFPHQLLIFTCMLWLLSCLCAGLVTGTKCYQFLNYINQEWLCFELRTQCKTKEMGSVQQQEGLATCAYTYYINLFCLEILSLTVLSCLCKKYTHSCLELLPHVGIKRDWMFLRWK